jgi:hypothetical protein
MPSTSQSTCKVCKVEAPANVLLFRNVSWICENCMDRPLLKDVLVQLYREDRLEPARYIYISEFTNNLDKIRDQLIENVELSHPYCNVTLMLPAAVHRLFLSYNGVFYDKDCIPDGELETVKLRANGFKRAVDPTTQKLL